MSDQVMNQEEMNQDVQNEQPAMDADMLNRDQNGNVILKVKNTGDMIFNCEKAAA